MFDFTEYELVDLTLSYDDQIAGFQQHTAKKLEEDGWNARNLTIYSHAGTHMDAPLHFGVSEQSIDQLPVDSCIGPAKLLEASIERDGQLLDLQLFSEQLQDIEPGDSIIIRTGWSQHLGTSRYRDHLPRISEELALWFVEKKIKMLGVEPPSVADVNNIHEVTKIHQILLGAGIIIIEGLTALDKLHSKRLFLIALPLKISGGDGAPARVIAFQPKQ